MVAPRDFATLKFGQRSFCPSPPPEKCSPYAYVYYYFISQSLNERGEKLQSLEDRTQEMRDKAEQYSKNAHALAQKFKDKKWYQI